MKFISTMAIIAVGWVGVAYAQNRTITVEAQQETPAADQNLETVDGVEKKPAVEGESTPSVPEEKGAMTTTELPTPELTFKERERLLKDRAVEYERENATSRFKKKAIREAEKREERQREIKEEQAKVQTSFRQKAIERAKERDRERQEKIEEQQTKGSRFTELARQRAAKRAEKARRKMEKVNRRRSKPITGVPID